MPSIPINAIEALRLTCKNCNAALIIPLDAREVPCRCFNCAQQFPSANIQKLLLKLRYTQQDLKQNEHRHAIVLEAVLMDTHYDHN